MNIEDKMRMTIDEARKSLETGELPVGAVIFRGDEVISRAHSSGESSLEFLPHAELVALLDADRQRFLPKERKQMQLFTTLEPCLMCMGAAMSFFIGEVYYALDASIDGAAVYTRRYWQENHEEIPSYGIPAICGGVLETEARALLEEYLELVPGGQLAAYVKTLLGQT